MNKLFYASLTARMMLVIHLAILMMTCSCLPLGKEVTSGYRPTETALAFLRNGFTEREEVLSTLGQPTYTSKDDRVYVYIWGENQKWFGLTGLNAREYIDSGDIETAGEWGVFSEFDDHYGLFIEFNSNNLVLAHEKKRICPPLDEACRAWRHTPMETGDTLEKVLE